MSLQIFNYQDANITFINEDGTVMINATEMAKTFNKRPSKWLEIDYTQSFINELSNVRQRDISNLVFTKQGSPSNGGGTWMHEDVALEFARWLSPKFAIWCNDRIKELLKVGITATQDTIDQILGDPEFGIKLLTQLKEERKKTEIATHQLQLANSTIEEQAPKVTYYDDVLCSTSTYMPTQLAKELGFRSCIAFHQELRSRGIIWKVNHQWILTSKWAGNGFTKTNTHTYRNSKNEECTAVTTVWTEKGRKWLHELFDK